MPDVKYPKPKLGSLAPDFNAENQKGETITLKNLLKTGQKVLLIFYPADQTTGCTTQLCGVRDYYEEYKKAGVAVLGINHADAVSHQKFIDKHNYQFDILIDTNRMISENYGQLKFMFGHRSIKRGVYLIDTDGRVIYTVQGQQDNQVILDLLKADKTADKND